MEYAVKARTAVEKYKGKFLIRGGKTTTNEGESSPRTVVIEFPSYDEANLFYKSKEYYCLNLLDNDRGRNIHLLESEIYS